MCHRTSGCKLVGMMGAAGKKRNKHSGFDSYPFPRPSDSEAEIKLIQAVLIARFVLSYVHRMNLNQDILWRIFVLSASDQRYNKMSTEPLITTRKSSQVCREWRHIILSSSRIWGRLVLIDNEQKVDWIDEVLRRSNTAPLWIHADLTPHWQAPHKIWPGRTFLFQVLENNWHRIEVMSIKCDMQDQILAGTHWEVFHRPAPMLRVFVASSDRSLSTPCCPGRFVENVSVKKAIFSQTSPVLHAFISNIDLIRRHTHSFQNMKTLDIYHSAKICQILHSIKEMPLLESLRLHVKHSNRFESAMPSEVLPVVHLPFLTKLTAILSITPFLVFFDRIRTPAHCFVSSAVHFHAQDLVEYPKFGEELQRQLRSILIKATNALFFTISDTAIRSSGTHLNLAFIYRYHPMYNFLPKFFSAFKSPSLAFVSNLHLQICDTRFSRLDIELALEDFLLSLDSVTHLHIADTKTSHNFNYSFGIKFTSSFPNLRTICVNYDMFDASRLSGYCMGDDDPLVSHILDILQTRRDIGKPLLTVHMRGRKLLSTETITYLCCLLDHLIGLNVICEDLSTGKKIEYLCGSVGR